ncbi:hypothetical protein RHMOL_Rhmol06G0287400 [Rhododendron molle]|uniref:Uncharacterized protein n=1 Tax=Rhododendron molle TaxID=49168 RepID=A0ACC0NIX6_RHOML|nr:hypothetical protein RHMOL_Rhmol06G0287400 [Rhododendron molle]
MGGGGAMRAASKVAGMTIANTGLRGVPSLHPAEHPFGAASRKATRPASSTVSFSDKNNYLIEASAQRPCWEFDDWEFADGEQEVIGCSGEPIPRLVFGAVPTIEEAREATSQLKDALDKVYLSSPYSTGSGDPYAGDHESDLLLCGTGQARAMSVPKDAIKAFRLLSESQVAQSVVASIASDPKIWDAVLENEALVEFFKSQKSNMDPVMEQYAADASFLDRQSSEIVDDSSDSAQFADYAYEYYMDYFQGVKSKVVEMMNTLSDYFQDLFRSPTAEIDGSAGTTFSGGAVAASFMGLAVMVIMLVVMKRG